MRGPSNDGSKNICDACCNCLAVIILGPLLMIPLLYVIFIIGFHEVSIYPFRNEDMKKEVISTNFNFFNLKI
jgi:hypothetical protein